MKPSKCKTVCSLACKVLMISITQRARMPATAPAPALKTSFLPSAPWSALQTRGRRSLDLAWHTDCLKNNLDSQQAPVMPDVGTRCPSGCGLVQRGIVVMCREKQKEKSIDFFVQIHHSWCFGSGVHQMANKAWRPLKEAGVQIWWKTFANLFLDQPGDWKLCLFW